MKWGWALLLASCVAALRPTPPVPEIVPVAPKAVDPQAALHETVTAFVEASEARRFGELLSMLARPLRERYSAETLARDFETEPLSAERLKAIKSKLTARLVESNDGAALEWAPGRSLRLVREAEGWRIAALE